MSAGGAYEDMQLNAASMHNGLPSAQSMKRYDQCCGIHGAARQRKGIKRGTSAARRRYEKVVVREALEELVSDE